MGQQPAPVKLAGLIIGTKMVLWAFNRDFETHQSTHESRAAKRKSRNRRQSPQGQCSAVEDYARRGACPPLGSGRGVAESHARIRRTNPRLRIFIPWCAGASRHERLVRKHVPDSDPGWPYAASIVPRNPINLPHRHSGEGRNPEGWGEGNVVRSKTTRGEGRGRIRSASSRYQATTRAFHTLVPATAGMSDWHENDGSWLLMASISGLECARIPRLPHSSTRPPLVIPAPLRHSGEGRNPEGRGWGM